tara:strand:+ start:238 stop:483 length:246 start_codon:yes stop_codon:yes gene_type:complete
MEISIYSSDVRDFDEQVESFFDIRHRWGADLFDENDRLTLKNYNYALEPDTYLAIMVDMQEQINELVAEVKELKQDGWSRK